MWLGTIPKEKFLANANAADRFTSNRYGNETHAPVICTSVHALEKLRFWITNHFPQCRIDADQMEIAITLCSTVDFRESNQCISGYPRASFPLGQEAASA
ncbi:MAG: hypothetical protein HYU73_00865 [Betaproteobacteria bacterium]|nr:hypothetical protein [Betaproteobacteria bacterium]